MQEMIAYCGLDCAKCEALIATQQNDDAKRAEVAQKWSQMFQVSLKSEDIYCTGCLATEGRLFQHCAVCDIRACAMEKQMTNCGYCAEYACSKLDKILPHVPEAKQRLDGIHSRL